MEIKATLLPGQNGIKELPQQYGEQLVCVRYRYGRSRRMRYKTVELILEEKAWIPKDAVARERELELHIGYEETGLREQVKTAGGRWNPARKAWVLQYREAEQLQLLGRVIGG